MTDHPISSQPESGKTPPADTEPQKDMSKLMWMDPNDLSETDRPLVEAHLRSELARVQRNQARREARRKLSDLNDAMESLKLAKPKRKPPKPITPPTSAPATPLKSILKKPQTPMTPAQFGQLYPEEAAKLRGLGEKAALDTNTGDAGPKLSRQEGKYIVRMARKAWHEKKRASLKAANAQRSKRAEWWNGEGDGDAAPMDISESL